MPREYDENVNPPHNTTCPTADSERARAFDHHKRANTMDTFFHVYNGDRPVSPLPHERERTR